MKAEEIIERTRDLVQEELGVESDDLWAHKDFPEVATCER